MRNLFSIVCVLLLFSCNKIEKGENLSKEDISRLRKLHLLDEGEKVGKFYSNFKNQYAGNFFTSKRVAMYWLDKKDTTRNEAKSAFYQEIKSFDTVYNAGLTYAPYIQVNKLDGSSFKVYVDGKKKDIKAFFEDIIQLWQAHNRTTGIQ